MRSEIYKELGARCRSMRMDARLTQDQLAAISGVKRSTIASLEVGAQRVTLDTLYQICQPLGVEPASLLPPIEPPIPIYKSEETLMVVADVHAILDGQKA